MESLQLFVYGTLLAGERNHHFLHSATCVDQECWVYGKLYGTGLGYPVLELDPMKKNKVVGEVYLLEDKHLPLIDRLEGYKQPGEPDLYERVQENVYTSNGAQLAMIYINVAFIVQPEKWIASGDWRKFRMSSEKYPVILQETWDRAISQQDRLLFAELNEQYKPVPGELRFLSVRTGFNHEGRCFATVLIQNGTDQWVDFSHVNLTYQAECGIMYTQMFNIPELVVQAHSSTPWTFLFNDEHGVRKKVEQGRVKLVPWNVYFTK